MGPKDFLGSAVRESEPAKLPRGKVAAEGAMRFLFLSLLAGCCTLAACSADDEGPKPPSECRSQCELAGSCEPRAFDDYPDYEGTLAEWGLPDDCGDLAFALDGTCADGTRFIRIGTGYTNELRYFDEDGAFLSLTTATDVADLTCEGHGYWPDTLVCRDATVQTAYCGDTWAEGDAIDLPFADGVHP